MWDILLRIDWVEIKTEPGRIADLWLRFIDTSAYSIMVWTGSFDFNIPLPGTKTIYGEEK